MSPRPAYLAALLALAAAACANDATAPTPARAPEARPLYYWLNGYYASVLPLEYGAAINSSAAVVGKDTSGQGVYYAQGAMTPLTLASTVTSVSPVDLLNDGRILARGNGPNGPKALYYYSPTASPIDIAAPYWAEPHAMNNQGVAVGRYGAPGRSWGAFRWSATTGLADITPAGYDLGWVTDVSEDGHAIGWVQLVNDVYDFRWLPGGSAGQVLSSGFVGYQALNGGSVLGRYPGIGSAKWTPWGISWVGPNPSFYRVAKISPSGRYVGAYTDAATGQSRAWTSIGTGGATLLPLPAGFKSAWATDVNACGTVLGHGLLAATNQRRAIVWSRSFTCDLSATLATTGTTAAMAP